MSPILDIQTRWRELGRIRLGSKGSKGQPQKLTEFRITTASRTLADAVAAAYGGTVKKWQGAPADGQWEVFTTSNELDVAIPPGQTISQWYEMWSGGGCLRRCDGARDMINDQPCVCPEDRDEKQALAQEGKACKPTTRLSIVLPRIPDVGVWRLESHGWNAALELPGTLAILARATDAGVLLPAVLRIESRTSKREGQTRKFIVPVLELRTSISELTAGDSAGRGQVAALTPPSVDADTIERTPALPPPDGAVSAPPPAERDVAVAEFKAAAESVYPDPVARRAFYVAHAHRLNIKPANWIDEMPLDEMRALTRTLLEEPL